MTRAQKPSRSSRLRSSLRARRMASAFSRHGVRRLFIGAAHFHFPENTLTLHFLCAQRLIYIVVSYGYFHGKTISSRVRFPTLLRGKLIVKNSENRRFHRLGEDI